MAPRQLKLDVEDEAGSVPHRTTSTTMTRGWQGELEAEPESEADRGAH